MNLQAKLFYSLQEIKKSILGGADGGVTDVAWMVGSTETIVERIDGLLIEMGAPDEQLELQSQNFYETGDWLEVEHGNENF